MGKVIGIDLGTSNSAAAVLKDGKPIIIPAADGNCWWWKSISFCCCFY